MWPHLPNVHVLLVLPCICYIFSLPSNRVRSITYNSSRRWQGILLILDFLVHAQISFLLPSLLPYVKVPYRPFNNTSCSYRRCNNVIWIHPKTLGYIFGGPLSTTYRSLIKLWKVIEKFIHPSNGFGKAHVNSNTRYSFGYCSKTGSIPEAY